MPLQSEILKGSPRLEQAAAGGPSVRRAPPADDPDAVRRIHRRDRGAGDRRGHHQPARRLAAAAARLGTRCRS